MNMQMIKQVQKLQRDMVKTQEEINNTEFIGKSSIVTAVMTGNKKLKSLKIDSEEISKDEIEMLEDMIVIAINDAVKQIEKETEEKMGAYTKGLPNIPGLF
jgi:DNA-binding YbaB/EbfC family protein